MSGGRLGACHVRRGRGRHVSSRPRATCTPLCTMQMRIPLIWLHMHCRLPMAGTTCVTACPCAPCTACPWHGPTCAAACPWHGPTCAAACPCHGTTCVAACAWHGTTHAAACPCAACTACPCQPTAFAGACAAAGPNLYPAAAAAAASAAAAAATAANHTRAWLNFQGGHAAQPLTQVEHGQVGEAPPARVELPAHVV